MFAALEDLLKQVPRGRVTTPGELAAALGNPIAARWIGYYLLHHEHAAKCACHRVVRAGGLPGPYPDGMAAKLARLQAEGVETTDGCVDLARYGACAFTGDRPLTRLAQHQHDLAGRIRLRPRKTPSVVGGVDISYGRSEEAVAAYALVDVAGGELLWSTTIRRQVRFPYISSYLAFRELPLLVELVEEVRSQGRLAPVVIVDGTGILHPRGAGVACHLGVVTGLPTIGITKKLLCGKVDLRGLGPRQSRPIVLGDKAIGAAIRPTSGSARPLFVSPGHRTDLASSEQIVRALLAGRRLPLPLYWADRLSRQHVKNLR